MKKENFKTVFIIILILIIGILSLIVFNMQKVLILNTLNMKQSDYEKSKNYHQIIRREDEFVSIVSDFYQKGNRSVFYEVVTQKGTGEVANRIWFDIDGVVRNYYEKGKDEILNGNDMVFSITPVNLRCEYTGMFSLWNTRKFLNEISIKEEKWNGKDCYVISSYQLFPNDIKEVFIDKTTGLTLKYGDCEYEYEFDNVKDSVFEEPDMSQYTLNEEE